MYIFHHSEFKLGGGMSGYAGLEGADEMMTNNFVYVFSLSFRILFQWLYNFNAFDLLNVLICFDLAAVFIFYDYKIRGYTMGIIDVWSLDWDTLC